MISKLVCYHTNWVLITSHLSKGIIKNVYTYIVEIDKDGEIISSKCVRGVARVNKRLSFRQVNYILKYGDRNRHLERMLNQMSEIAYLLKKKTRLS